MKLGYCGKFIDKPLNAAQQDGEKSAVMERLWVLNANADIGICKNVQ
jgi:hypothetical protein